MKKKKKADRKKMPLPQNRWEGIDDDAETEGRSAFIEQINEEERPGEMEDRAANFNPFDEDKFEANIF
jgi:hypothetical protein